MYRLLPQPSTEEIWWLSISLNIFACIIVIINLFLFLFSNYSLPSVLKPLCAYHLIPFPEKCSRCILELLFVHVYTSCFVGLRWLSALWIIEIHILFCKTISSVFLPAFNAICPATLTLPNKSDRIFHCLLSFPFSAFILLCTGTRQRRVHKKGGIYYVEMS